MPTLPDHLQKKYDAFIAQAEAAERSAETSPDPFKEKWLNVAKTYRDMARDLMSGGRL